MKHKIAIIDRRVLFTGSYNWTESAEEKNEENFLEFLEFIDDSIENGENSLECLYEKEIIKIYQERLDYLWEFNQEEVEIETQK